MAVRIVNTRINQFDEMLHQVCNSRDNQNFSFKPEIGSGSFQRYSGTHWDLYIGAFRITQDLYLERKPDLENSGQYSISFQAFKGELNTDEWSGSEVKKAGEGIVFYSNASHLNSVWHRNTECHVVYLSFSIDWVKQLEEQMAFPPIIADMLASRENPMFHVPLSSGMKHGLQQMLFLPREVHKDFVKPYLYNKTIELFTQASGLIVQGVEKHRQSGHIHPDDFLSLERIKIKIINNYQDPPSIKDITEETGMSKSKLQRLFQALYDTPVYQFIKSVRMEKAMELLMQGHTVTETAYDVGYSSIPNFSSAFKEHYHMQPGQIQRK